MAKPTVKVIEASKFSSSWLAECCCGYDVYHTPEYLRAVTAVGLAKGVVVTARLGCAEIMVPLVLTEVPVGMSGESPLFDAASPYGYGGPICKTDLGDKAARSLFESLVETLAEFGVVSLFLRWHPLFCSEALRYVSGAAKVGETVVVRPHGDEGAFRGQLRSGHRSEINWLRRNGFEVVWNDWAYYDHFQVIYRETMQRLDASSYYYFPAEYFYAIKELLGSKLDLGVVLAENGRVVAAGLFLVGTDVVNYHLSGADLSFRKRSPTKLLLYEGVVRYSVGGRRFLHLGGGLGAKVDPLYKFKAGFSRERWEYWVSKIIVNADAYKSACESSLISHPVGIGEDTIFPPYKVRNGSASHDA